MWKEDQLTASGIGIEKRREGGGVEVEKEERERLSQWGREAVSIGVDGHLTFSSDEER